MAAVPAELLNSPDQLRAAIIAKLGIDPSKLVAFGGGPSFDDQINSLYRTTTDKYGALDLQEARARQDYERGLSSLADSQKNDLRRLDNDLADRGLGYSGAAIRRRAQLGQDYGNRLQNLNTAQTRGIEDVGTARNQSLDSLLSGKSAYEASYTDQLQQFLQQQAQNQAGLTASGTTAGTVPHKTVTTTVKHPTATTPKVVSTSVKTPVIKSSVTPSGQTKVKTAGTAF